MIYINFIPTLFAWWYSKGINSLFEFLTVFFVHTSDYFSPLDVFANLFKPWKRDVGRKGRGVEALKQWFADNLVSRLIGLFMRLVLLIVYGLFLAGYLIFLILSITFWIIMPAWVLASLIFIFI